MLPLGQPAWALQPGDGLVAAQDPNADLSWADQILAVHEHSVVLWAAVGTKPEQYGQRVLRRPGVRAVTLTPAGADPRLTAVGLRFATRLGVQRWSSGDQALACLTCWSKPRPPEGWTRLPHLLSVDTGRGIHDTVIWELISEPDAVKWIGTSDPDFGFVEAHVDTLCALRAAARAGQLPATHAGQRLRGLLRQHDLTIRLVYRHTELFRLLVLDHALTHGQGDTKAG